MESKLWLYAYLALGGAVLFFGGYYLGLSEKSFQRTELQNTVYYKEKKREFLESIALYSENWYDFDIDIEEIVIQKDKIVLNYRWEGSKENNGQIFIFHSVEIISLNRKKDKIKKIQTFWTENLFKNQF